MKNFVKYILLIMATIGTVRAESTGGAPYVHFLGNDVFSGTYQGKSFGSMILLNYREREFVSFTYNHLEEINGYLYNDTNEQRVWTPDIADPFISAQGLYSMNSSANASPNVLRAEIESRAFSPFSPEGASTSIQIRDTLVFDSKSGRPYIDVELVATIDQQYIDNGARDSRAQGTTRVIFGVGNQFGINQPWNSTPVFQFAWLDDKDLTSPVRSWIKTAETGDRDVTQSFISSLSPCSITNTSSVCGGLGSYRFKTSVPTGIPIALYRDLVLSADNGDYMRIQNNFYIKEFGEEEDMILSSAGKFSYKQIPSVPEPGAWAFLLSGFMLIVACARRRVSVN